MIKGWNDICSSSTERAGYLCTGVEQHLLWWHLVESGGPTIVTTPAAVAREGWEEEEDLQC